MGSVKSTIKPGTLKPFFPFAQLPPEYVIITANFASLVSVEDGEPVIERNSEDPNDYFLVDGELASEDIYGTEILIRGGTHEAWQPLPQLRPSVYCIKGRGAATLIKVPREVIRRMCAEAPEKDLVVEDDITLDITQTREFFNDFKEELQMNRVRLPSLRPSATRVHKLLAAGKVGEADLIAAVSMDPAITAKLLKMANSSLFNHQETVQSVQGIVQRLGTFSTREIAACFAFRDVYKNSPPELVSRLEDQVTEARRVSAMAAAIAEISDDVDPSVAALAGLLHNIGVLPIFSYSMHNVAYAMNPKLVDRAIRKISRQAGMLLAKKWRFSDEIIQSIEHSMDWSYESGDRPNLMNIVLTARYHYSLSRSGLKSIPKPRDVPSIAAATRGKFDEKLSLKIISRAKELMGGSAAAYCSA